MNVKRPLNIALATSIALMSVGCKTLNAQDSNLLPQMQQDMTSSDSNGTNRENFTSGDNSSSQSRYEITFTGFSVVNEDSGEEDKSKYLFYVYVPNKNKKSTCTPSKCKNDKSNIFSLTDSVYLMIEADDDKQKVLDKMQKTSMYSVVVCPHHKEITSQCLKIPVKYLLDKKNELSNYCLTNHQNDNPSPDLPIKISSGSNKIICLGYTIEKQQKLHSQFQSNLEKLSPFFENNLDSYIYGEEFDFSKLPEVSNKSVSSVTFYANEVKASGLPTEIAQPVVDYLSEKYSNGLWVINGEYGALAAYGADQVIDGNASSISIEVNWPQGISEESINNWLRTPEKDQALRPYHTLRLYYKKGPDIIAKPVTGLYDTVDTVNETLTLPGRYVLETHLEIEKVELSGIFSLLEVESSVSATSIELKPKTEKKIQAQLELPDGDNYSCQLISKTIPDWFKTNTVMLQCPRLPKRLIEPDFVDGKIYVDAHEEKLQLGLRFKNRDHQGKPSLKDWCIKNTQICLTKEGNQGYMLVNARNLPKNSQLTLVPPKRSAFSIFYLNEQITVKLSEAQQKSLYTNEFTEEFGSSATIYLEVPNPKERPIETFKDNQNPWTPETLTFLCDMTQSEKELCEKTCTLEPINVAKNVAKSVGLICEGKKQKMPLKDLKGYWIISRFLGRDWKNEIPLAKLNSEESLKNFFCGAWHLLFPVEDMVIVVGSKEHKEEIRNAQLRNTIQHNTQKQKQIKFRYTTKDDKQYIWYDFLDSSGNWQLDSVLGGYDYYLHQDYARKKNGKFLKFSIRSEDICTKLQNSQSFPNRNGSPSRQRDSSATTQDNTTQIDIVAVFAKNYNFQQPVPRIKLSGLNTSKTNAAGWMRTWNKPATQSSLRDAINKAFKNAFSQRNPSVKLYYLYDNEKDSENKWLWSSMGDLKNAPSIKERQDMAKVVNISDVVLENEILPVERSLDDQVTEIINRITRQWQGDGDYLLVILSDGISEQEMKQLNKNMLPPGNGKRQLLVLTSDFLPTDSRQSLSALPKLPPNTEDIVISMYDKDWIEKFVKAIFKF